MKQTVFQIGKFTPKSTGNVYIISQTLVTV